MRYKLTLTQRIELIVSLLLALAVFLWGVTAINARSAINLAYNPTPLEAQTQHTSDLYQPLALIMDTL